MASASDDNQLVFLKEKHIKCCLRCLNVLPETCESFDYTRLMIVFFSISSLDLMNALSSLGSDKKHIIEWVYHLQVFPSETDANCGFCGSSSLTVGNVHLATPDLCDQPHITMTYTALSTLLILEDDLSLVNKKGILQSLKQLQLPDGSFRALSIESENDMRFVYCASCICYILQDWSGMDKKKTVEYIKNSMRYDGGIAQGPGLEAHGGSTFCGVASLWLMGELDNALSKHQLKMLIRWCLLRQRNGFQGRPNKPTDTCYTFWVGATLKLLESYHFINRMELINFVLKAQDEVTGGISKSIFGGPDIMHTYLGISGLSLLNIEGTSPVHPALNISLKAVEFLKKLHNQWTCQN